MTPTNDRDDTRQETELRLEQSRRLAEQRLAEVRSAVERQAGRVPRNATLLLAGAAVVGAAGIAGLVLALRGRGRRARRV
jgi:hypothetical protein